MLLFKLAYRNLIRQKTRNGFLALALSVGVAVYLLATGFAYGISDIMLNKFMALISGHVEIAVQERTDKTRDVIRDKQAIIEVIEKTVPQVKKVYESIQAWGRAVGHGAGDSAIFTGVTSEDVRGSVFKVREGTLDLFQNPDQLSVSGHPPLALYGPMAEKLNVQVGDIVKAKFQRITGQMESAQYELVAILHEANLFAHFSLYVRMHELKNALGYAEHETKKIQLLLRQPKQAKKVAADLMKAFEPEGKGFVFDQGTIWPIKKNPEYFSDGKFIQDWEASSGVVLSESEYLDLGVEVGESITLSYASKFSGDFKKETTLLGWQKDYPHDHFMTQSFFQQEIIRHPPKEWVAPDESSPPILASHRLLEASDTAQSIRLKYAKLNRENPKGMIMDIRTMYETGSDILKIEDAIKLISYLCLFIIMLIIFVGVTNIMRMSIRERTREIGTVRAMGMQGWDVSLLFLLEIILLSIFACLIGLFLYLGSSFLLSLLEFEGGSALDMFLLDGHLHFVIEPLAALTSMFSVVLITTGVAFFSASRAARFSPADALRST